MTLTVAICTNGRDSLVHAVRSIGNQSRTPDQLLIVDQSGSGRAHQAVSEAGYQGQVTVLEQAERGLSKARNLVVENVQTDWVFFTDDDCIVSLDLVDQFHKVAAHYPDAAFIAGTCIRPLDYNPLTHDVPGVLISNQCEFNAKTVMKDEAFMGACLAFRRDLMDTVGKFDPFLGAGTEWPAGEECDYVFRAILAGFKGRANARLVVFHEYGARKRPPDDTDNGRIGNAVVMWKMRKIGSEQGMEMANRIYPAGPKKAMLSKLTLGRLHSVDLRMQQKCRVVEARLDREFDVKDGVLVPRL